MMTQWWERWVEFYSAGGHVMPPLVVGTLVLWYTLGLRLVTLQRGTRTGLSQAVDEALIRSGVSKSGALLPDAISAAVTAMKSGPVSEVRNLVEEALYPFHRQLGQGRTLVRVIVLAAPLAGLLGTVSGMIETFDSLAEMAMFTQSGGIAAGISQALITTQMGLVVAAPGVVIGRILEKRENALNDELERLKDLVIARSKS